MTKHLAFSAPQWLPPKLNCSLYNPFLLIQKCYGFKKLPIQLHIMILAYFKTPFSLVTMSAANGFPIG